MSLSTNCLAQALKNGTLYTDKNRFLDNFGDIGYFPTKHLKVSNGTLMVETRCSTAGSEMGQQRLNKPLGYWYNKERQTQLKPSPHFKMILKQQAGSAALGPLGPLD